MIKQSHINVLNAYKAVALCCLILLHSLIWWLSPNDRVLIGNPSFISFIVVPYFTLFGWFGLSFAFISGFSLRFWLQPGWDFEKGKLKANAFPKYQDIIKRTVILAGIGFILNYKSWYIFQFLSVSTLVILLLLKRFNIWILTFFGLLAMICSDPLRTYLQPWDAHYWKAILVGSKNGAYFWPFFPWFSSVIFGFLLGHFRLLRPKQNLRVFRGVCLLLGGALINLTYSLDLLSPSLDINNVWGPAIFQPPLGQFSGWIGLMFLSYGLLDICFSARSLGRFNFFQVIGKNSLSIYLLHYIFFSYVFSLLRIRHPWQLVSLILAQYVGGYLVGLLLERFRTLQERT